jgi:hypothetical protein
MTFFRAKPNSSAEQLLFGLSRNVVAEQFSALQLWLSSASLERFLQVVTQIMTVRGLP